MYGTVDQFYGLAAPPDSLWPTGRVRAGRVDLPTPDAGNTGTGLVDARGNPHGIYSMVIECTAAGEINRSGVPNPGALPEFRLSLDGLTFSRSFRVSPDCDTAYLRDEVTQLQCGIVLSFYGSTPVFAVGDAWTTSCEPSPDVILHLDFAGSAIDDALGDTVALPLTVVPRPVIYCQGVLARWALIQKCGLDKDQDHKVYSPNNPDPQLGGISVADKLERWRRGQDIAQFAVADEGASRFPKFVKYSLPLASYLKV